MSIQKERYKQLLSEIREKIAKPENWTQREYALTADNAKCHPSSPEACKFCLTGAAWAIMADGNFDYYSNNSGAFQMFNQVFLDMYGGPETFNDHHSHAEVITVLDRLINE